MKDVMFGILIERTSRRKNDDLMDSFILESQGRGSLRERKVAGKSVSKDGEREEGRSVRKYTRIWSSIIR